MSVNCPPTEERLDYKMPSEPPFESLASNETPALDDLSSPVSNSSPTPGPSSSVTVDYVGPSRHQPPNRAYVFVPPRPLKRPLPVDTSSEEPSSDREDDRFFSNPKRDSTIVSDSEPEPDDELLRRTDEPSSDDENSRSLSSEPDDESSSLREVDNEPSLHSST